MSTTTALRPRTRTFVWGRRIALLLIATLLLGYLTICTIVANTLTVPRRNGVTMLPDVGWQYTSTPTSVGLAYEDVAFPARGGDANIRAWFIPAEKDAPAIMVVHGKDGCRTCEFQHNGLHFAQAMHARGFALLMLDLRGHGESSDAHFTFGIKERRDILGGYDWLRSQGVARIGLQGMSMGAASSIGAAADEPGIAALVADSSFATIRPVLAQEFPKASGLPGFFLPGALAMTRFTAGTNIGASRPVDEIGRIAPRPVLLIHTKTDKLIPYTNAEQLAAAAPGAALWITGGTGHVRSFTFDQPAYVERVATFFAAALR